MRCLLAWDFFGPESAGTATHFSSHLRQFLGLHGLSYEPETEVDGARSSVLLGVDEADVERLRSALRPRRILQLEP
jgi:hypothetical protein